MPQRNWLISLFIGLGIWGGSLPAYSQALLPYSPKLDSEQLEQQGLELAEEAIQLARFQQPEAALSRAKLSAQLAPQRFQTWFILGTLYLQQEEIDKGIQALEKALALEPKEAGILFTLGSAYFQKGEYKKAIAEIEKGLTLKPDIPAAFFDLGNAYFKLQDYSKAIAAYEKAVKQEGKFWPAINNMGLIKYEQGNVKEALAKWQAALAIDEEQPEPQLAVAVALYAQGQTEQGLSLAEKALRLDSSYGDLKFLEANLWGPRLLKDTQTLLETPQIQELLKRLEASPQQ